MKRVVTALVSAAVVAGALTACAPKNPHHLPIDHIVVLMQENRSADHYLGQLNSQGQPDYEAEPTTGNPDPLNPTRPADPAVPQDGVLREQPTSTTPGTGCTRSVNDGAMDGFTAANDTASANADPTDPDRRPHDGLLRPDRPALLLRPVQHVRDQRPLLLVGADARRSRTGCTCSRARRSATSATTPASSVRRRSRSSSCSTRAS